ncbi:MAG: hypothetical protein JWP58_1983 [Hymenobacter sp.]|nr:hypothetical protein [Hymenobacter sp.]
MQHFSTTPPDPGQHFFGRLRQWLAALLVLLAAPGAWAQAPAWQSAIAVSGGGSSHCRATATDAAGNIYLAGYFSGTVSFGSTTLTAVPTGTYYSDDAFVAKWSPITRSFMWAVQAGGTEDDDVATGIAVNGTSVYVTGYFFGPTSTFGPTTLTNASPAGSRSASTDVFVTKLTDLGSSAAFAWTQGFGGTSYDTPGGIAVSGPNVYVAGNFNSPALTFGATTLSPAVGGSGFLLKLTDTGSAASVAWAERLGPCRKLALRGADVFVAGDFTSTQATFGTFTLPNAHPGSQEVFVAKYTDTGSGATLGWVQQAGGSGQETLSGLAVEGTNVYITGDFMSATAAFGSASITNSSAGSKYNGFVAKLVDAGSAGTFTWATRLGSASNEGARAVAVRGANVYVAGSFESQGSFGPFSLTSSGAMDLYVAKLVDIGAAPSFAWVQQAGGAGGYHASAGSVLLVGATVYVSGWANLPTRFGALALAGSSNITAVMATLTDPALTATAGPRALPDVAVFPNPAHATATVQLPPVSGTATLTLLDALGRVVRTTTVPLPAAGLRHELDLAGLPAGLYALRVAAGASTATHRLVVE